MHVASACVSGAIKAKLENTIIVPSIMELRSLWMGTAQSVRCQYKLWRLFVREAKTENSIFNYFDNSSARELNINYVMAFTRNLASHETFHAGTIWLSVHSYWTSFFSLHIPKRALFEYDIANSQPPTEPNRCVMSFTKHNFFYFVLSQKLFPFFENYYLHFLLAHQDKFEVAQKLSKKNRKLFDLLLRWIGALLSREFEKRLLKVSALSAHFENKLRLLIINYFFVCSSFHIFLRIVMSSSRSFSAR